MTIYYPMQDSRHNDGLGPRLIVSYTEEGSLVRREAQLNPIDVGGFNQDEDEVPESFLDEFLLFFVLGCHLNEGGILFFCTLPCSLMHRWNNL